MHSYENSLELHEIFRKFNFLFHVISPELSSWCYMSFSFEFTLVPQLMRLVEEWADPVGEGGMVVEDPMY